MRTKEAITISLDKKLIEIINSYRGLVSRSKFIEFLLKKKLEHGKN